MTRLLTAAVLCLLLLPPEGFGQRNVLVRRLPVDPPIDLPADAQFGAEVAAFENFIVVAATGLSPPDIFFYRLEGGEFVLTPLSVPTSITRLSSFGQSMAFVENGCLFVANPGGFLAFYKPVRVDGVITHYQSRGGFLATEAGEFGETVAASGSLLAVGDPVGGQVFVFEVTGSCDDFQIVLKQTLTANNKGTSTFGAALSFKQGVLAVADPAAIIPSGFGLVNIYQTLQNNLVGQIGQLSGMQGMEFGSDVGLAPDGTQLAVGAPGAENDDGQVLIYDLPGSKQKGSLPVTLTVPAPAPGAGKRFGSLIDIGIVNRVRTLIASNLRGGSKGADLSSVTILELDGTSDSAQIQLDSAADAGSLSGNADGVIAVGLPQADGGRGRAIGLVETTVIFFDSFELASMSEVTSAR